MVPEHYLLLILSILPIIYKYFFWLFTIQLKEYRWDRFWEYLTTKQWNSAIINIWSVIELPLFLISLFIFINSPFEVIIYNVLFVFLLIQNIFVIRKIIKGKIIRPKLTWRLILTAFILLLLIFWDLFFIIINDLSNLIYSFVLFLLTFAPLIIFFSVLLTLPIVNYFKFKTINKAIEISEKIKWPIKIWITWSYWKSSVKEYLSSILEQHWETLKTPENINTELWVSSIVINKLKSHYKYFVAEMWAYKIWEIDLLWKIVNHKYWFLTAIWNQHIALFWSQDNIIKGKSEIANSVLKNEGILYVNWDDKFIRQKEFNLRLNIVRYWSLDWADATFSLAHTKNWVTEFLFKYRDIEEKFETNLLWNHNLINLTWVISCCYDLWLRTDEIKKYLKNLKTPDKTLTVINKTWYILIDDTYNLSEDWLYAWIDAINSFEWKKILVMDDILELWREANDIHFLVWKYLAEINKFDKILFSWINYKDYFIKWLLDWWYSKENIIYEIEKIEEKTIILFEWRNSEKYLNKLK